VLVRRITLAACALFLVVVVAASFADRETKRTQAEAPPTTIATGPPAPVVRGRLPDDKTVTARVGDAVAIEVRTEEPDDASIPKLGVEAPTSSDVPGVLEFVASQAGRYPVVLINADKPIGTVVVEPAQ
jgi:FtsP/CotA-like multicopper oxidase with cupredoxin domain